MKFDSIKKNDFQCCENCIDCSNLEINEEQLTKLINESVSKALQD